MNSPKRISDRRSFLSFLAASPVLAYAGFNARWIDEVLAAPLPEQNEVVIKSVKETLNIFDFEAVARVKLTPAHYEFITDGSFNNETMLANRTGFDKYEVRLRRLYGITKVDQSVKPVSYTHLTLPTIYSV